MTRTAFIVLGPEASGNRYLVNLLVSTWVVAGRGDYQQPFDAGGWHFKPPESDPERIAFCRSYPHAGEVPDLWVMLNEVESAGYSPFLLPLFRCDPYCQASQVMTGHKPSLKAAEDSIRDMKQRILYDVTLSCLPYALVAYEWLADPIYRNWLAGKLDLPPFTLAHVDGNAKYFPNLIGGGKAHG